MRLVQLGKETSVTLKANGTRAATDTANTAAITTSRPRADVNAVFACSGKSRVYRV